MIAAIALTGAALAAAAAVLLASTFWATSHTSGVLELTGDHGTGAAAADNAFAFSFHEPKPLPDLAFVDGDGRPLTLHEFRGRPVLLNVWATWCVPCRKEMPALDRLQAAVGPSQLLVVPLSIDRQGATAVKPFYRELGLKALGIYVDASGKAAHDLNTVGVPTTVLIDRDGREVGRKIGPAEWDTPDMIGLLERHLGSTAERK